MLFRSDSLCGAHRSWAFRLHAWDFMAPALQAYEAGKDRRYLDWCRDNAVSWARRFTEGSAGNTMAWYDMALGLRAPRLAYILAELVRLGGDPEAVEVLRSTIVRHQRELFADRAFNPSTNHGYYTAVGQLMFALRLRCLPAMDVMETQARERLDLVVRTQFASDGGHREHSPEYHRMVHASISRALTAGLFDDAEVADRVRRGDEVLEIGRASCRERVF